MDDDTKLLLTNMLEKVSRPTVRFTATKADFLRWVRERLDVDQNAEFTDQELEHVIRFAARHGGRNIDVVELAVRKVQDILAARDPETSKRPNREDPRAPNFTPDTRPFGTRTPFEN